MKEVSEYLCESKLSSISEAVNRLDEKLKDMEREAAAYLLVDFPNRNRFEEIATGLLEELQSEVVQVNSISSTVQTTVVSSPHALVSRIPVEDSLCIMTAGSGEPLMVSDIANDELFEGSYVRSLWGSWASAPIVVRGLEAGSVCALQHEPRAWTEQDRVSLESTASSIASEIDNWISEKDKT